MEIGELIDVSNQNAYLKSFEAGSIVKSKVLGIIRKSDAYQYIVHRGTASGLVSLFSGSSAHSIYVRVDDSENPEWLTLAELSSGEYSKIRALSASNTYWDIEIKRSQWKIPIIDVQMENGCYFTDGILSHNTGGNALKFYASVRVDVRKSTMIKSKGEEGEVIGCQTKIKIVKNKVGSPFRETLVEMRFGLGFSKELEIFNQAVELGLIDKAGAWYSYNGLRLGQGSENTLTALRTMPEVFEKLETEIRKVFFSPKAEAPIVEVGGISPESMGLPADLIGFDSMTKAGLI